MIEVRMTDDTEERLMEKTRETGEEMGCLDNSIVEDGQGRWLGLLAEFVFVEVFGGERHATYDYDVLYDGYKVDLKTKRRTVPPKGYYEGGVPNYNTEQDCDMYYFASVNKKNLVTHLCGWMSPSSFYDRAVPHPKGTVNPDNGFVYKTNTWEMEYDDLCTLPAANDIGNEVTI